MKVENLTSDSEEQPVSGSTPSVPGVVYVADSAGRRFGLKKLRPSDRFDLADGVDAKTQSTEMQAIVAATVFSIGDEAYPRIQNRAELRQRLDEIGDEGLMAITGPVIAMYGLDEKDIEAAKK